MQCGMRIAEWKTGGPTKTGVRVQGAGDRVLSTTFKEQSTGYRVPYI